MGLTSRPGVLLEAGKKGGRNGERNFRDQARSNATHASITDPDAKL